MADFGKTFKNARESMGLTIEQIAAETRIGSRFLEAIEAEQFHVLPGGIFSRGFVLSYAERLKLDPDKAVADFERHSSHREPALMESVTASVPAPQKKHRSLYPLALGALVALIIVFYLANRESGRSASAGQQPAMRAAAPAPTVAPPANPTNAAPPPAPAVATPPPAAAQSTVAAAPPAASPAPPNPAPPVAQSSPQPANQNLSIVLSARAESWVKVKTDGTTANAGEILQPGTTRQYTAQGMITLNLGNAGAVDIQINGHALRPLGKSGQVRSITITPDNLKDLLD